MRTLSAAEVQRLRSARAEGQTWGNLARALTANDRAAGLLAADQRWTSRTLAYVAEHPAPVRVVQGTACRDDRDDDPGSPSVLEGMVRGAQERPAPAAVLDEIGDPS